MAEFFALSPADRREALAVAADSSGRPIHLLEKDVWVVWALKALFESVHGTHLVFKGGTSLSKGYGVIGRFSEDVDLTYDIRIIAGDLIGKSGAILPRSKSQAKKWTDEIRARLPRLLSNEIAPLLTQLLGSQGLPASVETVAEKIFVKYDPLASGYGYVKPTVTLEFGARATGEPCEQRDVDCDAASYLPSVAFPTARPSLMRPERTFWEKATAIHVYCHRGEFRGGDRFARHWHDLTRLDATGYAASAIENSALAKDVADHKTVFFAEKNQAAEVIDYHHAVNGSLLLVPRDDALAALAEDYAGMVDDGLLLDEAVPFENLLKACQSILGACRT